MESSRDAKECSGNAPFVAFGIIIGGGLGAMGFALTQNPVWMGILPGFGLVVGAAFQANRR